MTASLSILDPVQHPGPRVEPRIISVPTAGRSVWATLPAGQRLLDALDALLDATGSSCAQVEILAGSLSEVAYCYPAIGATEAQPIHYSPTQRADGPVTIVGGGATVGHRDGARFMHCHAGWFDVAGRLRGGHVLEDTWIGMTGLAVALHTLDGADQRSAIDPESRLPVFTPTAAEAGAPEGRRTSVIARVCPNENLFEACATVMREAGMTDARVAASIGSLVGAALHRESGVLLVDGPATEVALNGRLGIGPDGDLAGELSAIVIDRHGRVHVGNLTRDNIVAVTVELLVEEVR
ncbi:DUF296 domain-containing protein [Nocardioides islandensis]|uniref:DUF296 domain-containing protein n=1 Tax=Nocardioides islandensis TaxID=433663 RepID=A0A930VGY6_9ACTN|nr:DUF296 domain-containing protein [Nocardioides islandensis]MBF4764376.1 DUF296 domain-containing protein [Nocardioides islandensis]